MSSEPSRPATTGDGGPGQEPPPAPFAVVSGLRLAAAMLTRPAALTRRATALIGELARIGLGTSTLAPRQTDDRFAEPAWSEDPVLRRAVQVHLAATDTAAALLQDAALPPGDDEAVRHVVDLVSDALAPVNNPLLWLRTRPAAAPPTTDTPPAAAHPAATDTPDTAGAPDSGAGAGTGTDDGGAPAARADAAAPDAPASGIAAPTGPATDTAAPRRPASTEPEPPARRLTLGEDIAATPGAVVLRTPVFELLHYLPQTREVRDVPLLVVPPATARFYLADLAPGRSIVEHLVRSGQQVLLLSWVNPGPEHTDWGLDTYVEALREAVAACERIARVPRTALLTFGSGAVTTRALLQRLAADGEQERVAAVAFAATALDAAAIDVADADSDAAVRDLRHWVADTPRVPAALDRDLRTAAPDLAGVDRDLYVVAGPDDGAGTWRSSYRTTQVTDGHSRFVRPSGGHAAALVTPPGTPEASFTVAESVAPGPDDWLADARTEPGSWWCDLDVWLAARCGGLREAPAELGGRKLPAVAPAPGAYVLAR